MKASDLREKTPDELRDLLAQYKKERFNLRFRAATGVRPPVEADE